MLRYDLQSFLVILLYLHGSTPSIHVSLLNILLAYVFIIKLKGNDVLVEFGKPCQRFISYFRSGYT